VFLYAFDLIELNGDDLRGDPLEVRKVTLANVLAFGSMTILRTTTARPYFGTPASLGSRASFQSAMTHPIALSLGDAWRPTEDQVMLISERQPKRERQPRDGSDDSHRRS
jgi:hypothetical protein